MMRALWNLLGPHDTSYGLSLLRGCIVGLILVGLYNLVF